MLPSTHSPAHAAFAPDRYLGLIDAALSPLLPANARVALLDFPNHSNVGDSAIWLGETRYLAQRRPDLRVVWTSDHQLASWRDLPRFSTDTVLLLHGGGNLGDLWPYHQAHRERIISHYRSHRIVQLPQSVHFDDGGSARRCAAIARQHDDLHVLVRDRPSLDLLNELRFRSVALCPDMALCLGRLERTGDPRHGVVALMRTDQERRAEFDSVADGGRSSLTGWTNPRTGYRG